MDDYRLLLKQSPFGLAMEGIGQLSAAPAQRYRYNGKELDGNLGVYDFNFRWYAPAIDREENTLSEQLGKPKFSGLYRRYKNDVEYFNATFGQSRATKTF